jgi:predicted secreted protein
MNDNDIFTKTPAGLDEVRTRASGLPQRVRSVLIMVDGVKTVRDLRVAVTRLEAPPETLDSLLDLGMIQLHAPAQVKAATGRSGTDGAALPQRSEAVDDDATTATAGDEIERFRVAKKFMNDTIVDAVGIRSFMFTLKLEKCATLNDLAQLAPEYTRMLEKAKGSEVAGALRTRLRELLR